MIEPIPPEWQRQGVTVIGPGKYGRLLTIRRGELVTHNSPYGIPEREETP